MHVHVCCINFSPALCFHKLKPFANMQKLVADESLCIWSILQSTSYRIIRRRFEPFACSVWLHVHVQFVVTYICNQLFLVLNCLQVFSNRESNANGLCRMHLHLAKPFSQFFRFKMASDYPVIGGLNFRCLCEAAIIGCDFDKLQSFNTMHLFPQALCQCSTINSHVIIDAIFSGR